LSRRVWLVALSLYAIAAVADVAVHLGADRRTSRDWLTPANLAVAVSASLFWPVDLAARLLLAR
jgi:hypothetical protein